MKKSLTFLIDLRRILLQCDNQAAVSLLTQPPNSNLLEHEMRRNFPDRKKGARGMRKWLLAIGLVLVMAIPVMSAVKPMPMAVAVYYDSLIYGLSCPSYLEGTGPWICASYDCVLGAEPLCLLYAWVARPLYWDWTGGISEVEVTQAGVGERYHVKGTIFSELPKNIKYQLIITKGITTLYKTARIPVTPLNGSQTIQFESFIFEEPGMYTFTLQVIRGDGTIAKVAKKVFVPTPPGAEPAFEEEPDLEEELDLEGTSSAPK